MKTPSTSSANMSSNPDSTASLHPKANDIEQQTQEPGQAIHLKVGFRERIKHFTFAWYLSTMSTGGLALALGETPHQFPGLYHLGLTLYLINLILFLTLCLLTLTRLILHPTHFLASFTHPSESLFISSFHLSLSVLLGGLQTYCVTHRSGLHAPWLLTTIYTLYWLYAALSLINAITTYSILVAYATIRPVAYTPALFLPGYSAMLTGTVASMVARTQSPARAGTVVLSGIAWQGFGWCISFVGIVAHVKSLLERGFPPKKLRPALFIPVGACAYTVVAIVGLAEGVPPRGSGRVGGGAGAFFRRYHEAGDVLRVVAVGVGCFLYVFAVWLCGLAVVGNLMGLVVERKKEKGEEGEGAVEFSLSWWAYVFPNVGFMLSTSVLGKELESEAILWVASAMTVLLVGLWIIAAVACVRAVWKRAIVWPGRDEDRDR
ncbi:C4-dicarboxylate transport mae1 [Pyrenophora seminiperda CCB06]|uniref:C4-dicarboxylate transport mae1 n=1 Tax=Pyrenophora seminiperda CCB06 TaxID=1302712 RepID=A0A3M7M4A2_9PLEO|nr:C4-dicarboxylate transport mae1 [Pyrenophora seminiperda CCB06]